MLRLTQKNVFTSHNVIILQKPFASLLLWDM